MDILIKIGDKRPSTDPYFPYDWRDGQIIDVRPSGFFTGSRDRVHHCVITTQHDWVSVVGKSGQILLPENAKEEYWKKLLHQMDAGGKYDWDAFFDLDSIARRRDWFIDLKWMLGQGWIGQKQYNGVYDKTKEHDLIYIDRDPIDYIFSEIDHTRVEKTAKEINDAIGTIDAGGTYTVGTSQDYSTWSSAAADLPSDIGAMTTPGDITLQGNTAEIVVENSQIDITLDTDNYTLTLENHPDYAHSGKYDETNDHVVQFGAGDKFKFDEASSGTLNSVIVRNMTFDIAGLHAVAVQPGNSCFYNSSYDGLIVENNVAVGNGANNYGFFYMYDHIQFCKKAIVRNNFIYNFGSSVHGPIHLNNAQTFGATNDWRIYNNTVVDSYYGIRIVGTVGTSGNFEIKNNLVYNCTGDCYSVPGGWTNFDTSKNVSSDSSSPDGATYQSWAGSANFTDYSGDDFTLGSDDTTLDDGDDLSSIGSPAQFDYDGTGQTRSTWYVGASEYVSAAATATNLLDGKLIISSVATNLLDGKTIIGSNATDLLDGKVVVDASANATNLLDGKVQIGDVATYQFDGKLVVGSDATGLLDGKVVLANNDTDLVDGKVVIKSDATLLLDGKIVLKSDATLLFDGRVYIAAQASSNLDGKVAIKDDATRLLDGKVVLSSNATPLLDGLIVISTGATDSLDGKIIISSNASDLLDGKLLIQADYGLNRFDGIIIIAGGTNHPYDPIYKWEFYI